MRNVLLVLWVVLMLVFAVNAQTSLGVFGGYGKSNFDFGNEEQDISQAGYLPIGVQLLFGDMIQVGAEFNYAVVPFTFEETMNDTKLGDLKVNQMIIGGVARVNLGSGDFRPYIRGGAGAYMGDVEYDYTDQFNEMGYEDSSEKMKTAFGFNAGAGFVSKMGSSNAFFAEFVYHIVKRKLDIEGAEKWTADNWAVQIGYQVGL